MQVIKANNLSVGFIEENSIRPDKAHINHVKTGEVAIFPRGYIHYEQNLDCEPAHILNAFSHEDPG